jgi:hypothetical protein
LPLVVIDVLEAVAHNPDSPGRAARGPDNGREQGRGSRGLPARLAAIETGPAAPSRPQPGTTNPSRKLSSLEGFVVPQGGRRASGRRGDSGSEAEHLARESPKNGAQARRFFGLAWAADRAKGTHLSRKFRVPHEVAAGGLSTATVFAVRECESNCDAKFSEQFGFSNLVKVRVH